MFQYELAVADSRKCILQLKDVRPFLSDKQIMNAVQKCVNILSRFKNIFRLIEKGLID